jgi:hypothetical protein
LITAQLEPELLGEAADIKKLEKYKEIINREDRDGKTERQIDR